MLDAESDALSNAARYERSESRKDTRAGYYQRDLHTKAGEVTLKVPKLRQQKFETSMISIVKGKRRFPFRLLDIYPWLDNLFLKRMIYHPLYLWPKRS